MPHESFDWSQWLFWIPRSEVQGPLNLEKTILSAQTSEPEWTRAGACFIDVKEVASKPVKYIVRQVGAVDDFTLEVKVVGVGLDANRVDDVKLRLKRLLGLEDDIATFYRAFSDPEEPLSLTFRNLRGLRLMRGITPYESLICSILSQNNSARLWNRSVRLLMEHFGERVVFPDGTESYLFPKPERLAKVNVNRLRAQTSIGYRAKSVVAVSKLISSLELKLEDLERCTYEEALGILLDLPGVGPKVADCFLLYGLGKLEAAPVDVWIHRIVTSLYFKGARVSRLKVGSFIRERFRKWAGYAQLYLFDFARHSGTLSQEKE